MNKKEQIAALILTCFLFSCNNPKEKPFIIVNKYPQNNVGSPVLWRYYYEDRNGREADFIDTIHYNIGDTLK